MCIGSFQSTESDFVDSNTTKLMMWLVTHWERWLRSWYCPWTSQWNLLNTDRYP